MVELDFIESMSIPDCKIIVPDVFKDHRGEYVCTFSEKEYEEKLGVKFVEDDISVSERNVFRGLHGDDKTWKLVQCLYGEIFLVLLDCRCENGSCQKFILSDENRLQVLVPPGCANGHYVLSDKAIFSYKQSEYYSGQKNQFTIKYNDPRIPRDFLYREFFPITSERDAVQ
ncbi:MAG: dTDP-4-dehydrorhamnose 3,5-epimerase [Spirochaetes bacterium]|nr:dTDP-4-dehydrorhamnose 3,5-epimerase [Spirochaetota bacterium]